MRVWCKVFFVLAFFLSVVLPQLAFARPQIEIVSGNSAPQLMTIVGRRQLPALVTVKLKGSSKKLVSISRSLQESARELHDISFAEPGLYSLHVVFRTRTGRKTSRQAYIMNLYETEFIPPDLPDVDQPEIPDPPPEVPPQIDWTMVHSLCPQDTVDSVFHLVNQARSGAGIPVLIEKAQLENAARIHSDRMAINQRLSHDGWFEEIIHSGFVGSSFAQNIASYEQNPDALLDAWLGSTVHRNAILNTMYVYSGIGCVIDSYGYYWWTQNFGA